MNSLTELSPGTFVKAAEIQTQILELRNELKQLLGVPTSAPTPAPALPKAAASGGTRAAKSAATPSTKPGKPSRNGLTINGAILKMLRQGKADVPTIVKGVSQMTGTNSKGAICQALVVLKKKGEIANPERGQYVIKK